MQLGLVALAMIFLSSMGHGDALKLKARRLHRGESFPPLPPLVIVSLSPSGSIRLLRCWLSSLRSDSQRLGVS